MIRTEERYRTLIEQLPIVTYIDTLDDRSSNIYTSPQLEPILGYSVEEWQADEELFVRILHPDDRERVLAEIRESNASAGRFESEYRLIARDGRVIWFRDESVVVRDESGAPLYSQGYLLDITDRKEAEEQARESEARFRVMADHAPALIWTAEPSGDVTFFSRSWLNFTGRTMEQEAGDGWVESVHPDDRSVAVAGYTDSVVSEREYQVEYRLRRHDGAYRWILERGGPRYQADGTLVGHIGIGVDITDRKEAQEALARREAVLGAVAAIAGELVAAQAWEDVDVVGRLRAAVATSRAYLVEDLSGEDGRRAGRLLAEATDGSACSLCEVVPGGRLDYDASGFGAFRAALERGEIVRRLASEFPPGERHWWDREGVLSTLVVPITAGAGHWGHIGFQDCLEERAWTDAEADALRAAAGILGAAIDRQAAAREERRARNALAASEARFAAFMDATPAVAFQKDVDGRYVYANAGWLRVFGHTPGEVLGRTDAELFPGHAKSFRAHDAAALESGGPVSQVDHVELEDAEHTFLALKFPFRDASGEWFVGGVSLDITERERAERELLSTTHALEAIVASSPLAIVTVDREGKVSRWNEAAERVFGWSEPEVLGRFNPLLPEGEEESFQRLLQAALDGRSRREVEALRRHKDGSLLDVSISSAPLVDASGEVTGMVLMLADVTERRRAERRLAAQHAVTRVLAECMTLDEAAPRVLEELCGALGWELAGLWTVDEERQRLRLASSWHAGDRRFDRFVDESWTLELGRGEGFPGTVWETGGVRWSVVDIAGFTRSQAAEAAGLHGALAGPVVGGGEVLGVLELFSAQTREPDDELVAMLTSVGGQIGQFIRRARADSDVREREERFRTLVANLPGAIYRCATDEEWTVNYMSDAIREITGHPASELVDRRNRTYGDLIHPDDRPEVDRILGGAIRAREQFELEYRIVHADGSVRWVAERGQPIIGPGGAVLWFDGAIFDVTGRKVAEAALAQERDLLRFFMEATPDHVYFKDAESRFLRISSSLARWLELDDPSQAVGKTDRDFFTEEHAAKARADEQEVLRTGKPMLNLEDRETWPDGTETWVVTSRLPLRGENGEIAGTFGISRDITERKLSEQALARTNHLLDSIVESLPTPLFLKDADELRYLRVNRAAEELWGVPREALLGKTDRDLLPPERADLVISADRRVVGDQRLLDIPEEPVETRELGTRYVHTRKAPIVDGAGRSRYLLATSLDVTERKLAAVELERLLARLEEQNEQLRELDRMKDDFVALVSHELRTPLTSILGYLELVLDGEAGEVSDEQARFLAIIERNAQRLLRLVGDLLFVAQIEAGKLTLEREPCDLPQLAADCIEAARPRAAEKRIELALDVETQAQLEGDRTRLAQLLDNLVSNAIKFTPEGGRVRVRLTGCERRVLVDVSDTGMGISPEEQEHLFERFFRAPEAERRAIQGTGLGLTITRAIAEAHGGTIEVESEPGSGTTFVVCLPLEPNGSGADGLLPTKEGRDNP